MNDDDVIRNTPALPPTTAHRHRTHRSPTVPARHEEPRLRSGKRIHICTFNVTVSGAVPLSHSVIRSKKDVSQGRSSQPTPAVAVADGENGPYRRPQSFRLFTPFSRPTRKHSVVQHAQREGCSQKHSHGCRPRLPQFHSLRPCNGTLLYWRENNTLLNSPGGWRQPELKKETPAHR